ncbi:unnamed protein product [Protopolystoma xenopodis]|uniref:Uncharacterized protein n=1 Tax=Protopolystoma xenopodis TaxID=117903 RepID=A0A3S5FG33_9PLAT|nr:unnamed protein product [Protopolystoma xenopodis]
MRTYTVQRPNRGDEGEDDDDEEEEEEEEEEDEEEEPKRRRSRSHCSSPGHFQPLEWQRFLLRTLAIADPSQCTPRLLGVATKSTYTHQCAHTLACCERRKAVLSGDCAKEEDRQRDNDREREREREGEGKREITRCQPHRLSNRARTNHDKGLTPVWLELRRGWRPVGPSTTRKHDAISLGSVILPRPGLMIGLDAMSLDEVDNVDDVENVDEVEVDQVTFGWLAKVWKEKSGRGGRDRLGHVGPALDGQTADSATFRQQTELWGL